MTGFAYTDAQWDKIKTVVSKRLRRDADESLRSRIETAAARHIDESALASQTLAHKARVKKLEALRVSADALHSDLLDAMRPSFTLGDDRARRVVLGGDRRARYGLNVDPLDEAGRAFATVMSVIDASIAACRPQETANTSKAGRDRFWNEMVVIWTGIGGVETGIAAAEFVVATSKPVFDRVLALGGHKTMASMPQDYEAVVEWLRLRAKSRQATP
jgi:hypothetical protein